MRPAHIDTEDEDDDDDDDGETWFNSIRNIIPCEIHTLV